MNIFLCLTWKRWIKKKIHPWSTLWKQHNCILSPGPCLAHNRLRLMPDLGGSQDGEGARSCCQQSHLLTSSHSLNSIASRGYQRRPAAACTRSRQGKSERTGSILLCISQLHSGPETVSSWDISQKAFGETVWITTLILQSVYVPVCTLQGCSWERI